MPSYVYNHLHYFPTRRSSDLLMDKRTNERQGGRMKTCKSAVRSMVVAGLVVFGLGVVKKAEAAPNADTMVMSVTPVGFTYAVVITSPVLSGTTGYDFTQVNLG